MRTIRNVVLLVGTSSVLLLFPAAANAAELCNTLPDLVAWYPGDGNADDAIGGNDGTPMNGATFATGVRGQAFSLDGTDDFISVPNSAVNDPTTAGSISAWVKFTTLPSTTGKVMTIASTGAFDKDFDLVADTDNHLHFYIKNGYHASSATIVTTGVWYHVAGTWDSTVGIRIYVNGKLEGSNDAHVTRDATGLVFEIGNSAYWSPRYFPGLIDELQVFGRSLSANEVGYDASCDTCGDANVDLKVTAPDALRILQAAVGQSVNCPDSRCDTDSSGKVLTSDALRTLQFGVGQSVLLRCPIDAGT